MGEKTKDRWPPSKTSKQEMTTMSNAGMVEVHRNGFTQLTGRGAPRNGPFQAKFVGPAEAETVEAQTTANVTSV